jgi:hypothetical protein
LSPEQRGCLIGGFWLALILVFGAVAAAIAGLAALTSGMECSGTIATCHGGSQLRGAVVGIAVLSAFIVLAIVVGRVLFGPRGTLKTSSKNAGAGETNSGEVPSRPPMKGFTEEEP